MKEEKRVSVRLDFELWFFGRSVGYRLFECRIVRLELLGLVVF